MRLHRGDIVLVDLGRPCPGNHEQAGLRPCVVVSNDVGNRHAPIIVVVPLSRRPPRLPTHAGIRHPSLPCASTALAEQVRVVDRQRIVRQLGRLDEGQMREVDRALALALGLAPVHAVAAPV